MEKGLAGNMEIAPLNDVILSDTDKHTCLPRYETQGWLMAM